MAYKHGVQVSEVPTSITPPVEVSAGIPFIVGTAPVNMVDPANVNKPIICYSYDEAVAAFGYVPPVLDEASGLKKYEYSLSEAIHTQFALFGVSPVVIVNVLDPNRHKKAAAVKAVTLDAKTGAGVIEETGILLDSVTLASSSGAAYERGKDFVAAFDDDGRMVITSVKGEDGAFVCETGAALTFSAEKLDPSAVTADDIVGGVDVEGNKAGLELIGEIFSRFRVVPGIIAAPGFSHSPTVAAVMAAKAANISGNFKAVCVVDVPTEEVKSYSAVAEWKNTNNIVDPLQIACWPMLKLDGVAFHMSAQVTALMGLVDSENDDMPFVSPSNNNFQCNGAVLANGKEVWLDREQAEETLNGQGVVTALNFIGGWKCWGNRTAAYPAITDVKDTFIPIRRMFNHAGNGFVLDNWQRLDKPITPRLIQTIVDSTNLKFNAWKAAGYILGGKCEFLKSENPDVNLVDGKLKFHLYITPPPPVRQIDGVLEFDVKNLSTIFA